MSKPRVDIWTDALGKTIPGFPDYSVTANGEVWSTRRSKKPILLKPYIPPDGYPRVTLSNGDGRTNYHVHTLVLEAFIGPCPLGLECRHVNGKRNDNRLENLAWGTRKENAADAIKHGTMPRGESSGVSKLNETSVFEIRKQYAAGNLTRAIAADYAMSKTNVIDIATGRIWKHVGGPITRRSDESCWQRRYTAKLTPEAVREIRSAYELGALQRELADKYGVSQSAISKIVLRKDWRNV